MADTQPPASSDGFVQDFLEQHWRDALRTTRETMNTLREVWPEFAQQLPETGAHALQRALEESEQAYHSLHRAGKFVLGSDAYARYLEAQAEQKIA
jgi:hypothetical protein